MLQPFKLYIKSDVGAAHQDSKVNYKAASEIQNYLYRKHMANC